MRGAVSSCALLAGLVAAPGLAEAATATCLNVVAGEHAFAGLNEACVAPAGTYNPIATSGVLPFVDPGYGFVAYGNGQLSSAGAVTINAPDNAGAAGVLSDGLGVTTLTKGATIATTGAGEYGAVAINGGAVTLGAVGAVTTVASRAATGSNGADLLATGVGSSLAATNVKASFAYGGGGIGVFADQSATMTLTGGSVSSTGAFVVNVGAFDQARLTLNATTLIATGAAGNTLWAANGGQIDGANLTIVSSGGLDPASGNFALGASNNAYGSAGAGGTLNLTNSSITLTQQGGGVYTANGGVTTLTNDSLSLNAAGGFGVQSGVGGQTGIVGGTISSGASLGLQATGAGASITTSLANGLGTVVSTTGAYAHGAQADTGGAMTLQGGSVTTAGAGAIGLFATGANSTISAAGVNVATSGGSFANAVYAVNGGSIVMTGGAAKTSGADSYAVAAEPGGSVRLSGVTVTATGAGSGGLVVNGSTASITGDDLTILVKGVYDPTLDSYPTGVANQGSTSAPAGGTVKLTNSTIAMTGDYGTGVLTANAGATTISGGSISTSGFAAVATQTQTGGALTLSGVQVTTLGDGAKGLSVVGAGTTLSGANLGVSTSGTVEAGTDVQANALYNGNGGGSAGGATGGGAVTLTGSALSTSGDHAHGAVTENGGATTLSGGSVATSGRQSDAIFGSSGGVITLAGERLATTGDAAKGIDIEGAGTKLTGAGLTISTSGTTDAATGFHAQGVYNGSSTPPSAGQIGGGVVSLTDSSVKTSGANADGVDTANGGATTFAGGAISTSGTGAVALLASSGGSVVVQKDSAGQATTIVASGFSTSAVAADSGASIALTGAAIISGGSGSTGVSLRDAGTAVTLTSVTVDTTGRVGPDGNFALALYNGPGATGTSGGTLTLVDVAATTLRDGASGLVADSGSHTSATGGSIATSGADAAAVAALNGSQMQLNGVALSTQGDGATGLALNGAGGTVGAADLTITTAGGVSSATGSHADGVYNGAFGAYAGGGALKLADSTVTTSGYEAYGVSVGAGGTTTFLGGVVTTSGEGASGLRVAGGGSLTVGPDAAGAATVVNTSGAGAHGLYVGDAGSQADLAGAVTINVSGANAGGVYVDSGGAVEAKGPLTVNAASYGLYINGYSSGPTALSLAGPLTLKTSDPQGAAITLSGNGASFAGTGGGVIDAAGSALAFLNGAGQSATFANYQIDSPDIIYADPATATVAFNNSTVNAGTGDLARIVGGSDLTLTAVASTLTGAIETQAGAVSHVTLSGGSTWNITGDSTVSNLSLVNSQASFAPSSGGVFHTLTVTNFTGQGGSLTFNAALSGSNPGADRLVIDGGQATGATTINIRPLGNAGAATTGLGVPLVVTSNGATIAPGAFALSGPLTVGGYTYSLQSQDGGEYLVSNQGLSPAAASGSLASLAQSKQSQAITGRVLTSILLGATEQINCSSCSSGFASFGSFAIGAHGRWTLSPSLALLAGASYDSYSARGVAVNNSLEAAIGLRYDMVQLGRYRPFFEAGIAVSPYANISFSRSYASGAGAAVGVGDTLSRSAAAYGRAGYIWRLTPKDETAAYASFTRSWQSSAGYLEGATAGNPFGALVLPSLDTMNIAEFGAQYTHLFGQHIEANVSAGYAVAFDANYGADAMISGFGSASGLAPTSFNWVELGGRLSYRFSKTVIADAFVLGTLGAEPAGNQVHGGLALRMEF